MYKWAFILKQAQPNRSKSNKIYFPLANATHFGGAGGGFTYSHALMHGQNEHGKKSTHNSNTFSVHSQSRSFFCGSKHMVWCCYRGSA